VDRHVIVDRPVWNSLVQCGACLVDDVSVGAVFGGGGGWAGLVESRATQPALLDEWAYDRTYRSERARAARLGIYFHTYDHQCGHTALNGQPPITCINHRPGARRRTVGPRSADVTAFHG
jgi:hypothetical protein